MLLQVLAKIFVHNTTGFLEMHTIKYALTYHLAAAFIFEYDHISAFSVEIILFFSFYHEIM